MDRADAVVQITRSQHGRSFESSHGWCFYRGYVQRREQGVDRPRNPVAGRAHRPVLVADITALIDAAGGANAASQEEVAQATATAVISAGAERSSDCAHTLVTLADVVGLDTLAELWRDADPVSLPGALWALYLLREWCQRQPDAVCRLWRAGAPRAAVDAVIAGCAADAGEEDVRRTANDILAGICTSDVALVFERASAFYRVIAEGRRERTADDTAWLPDIASRPPNPRPLADRNDAAAAHLATAARLWRKGELG
jgi:hypothetical protein